MNIALPNPSVICLTDSGTVIGSGAVKDDFLMFRESRKP